MHFTMASPSVPSKRPRTGRGRCGCCVKWMSFGWSRTLYLRRLHQCHGEVVASGSGQSICWQRWFEEALRKMWLLWAQESVLAPKRGNGTWPWTFYMACAKKRSIRTLWHSMLASVLVAPSGCWHWTCSGRCQALGCSLMSSLSVQPSQRVRKGWSGRQTLGLFADMQSKQVDLDDFSYNALISSFSRASEWQYALHVLQEKAASNFDMDIHACRCCCQCVRAHRTMAACPGVVARSPGSPRKSQQPTEEALWIDWNWTDPHHTSFEAITWMASGLWGILSCSQRRADDPWFLQVHCRNASFMCSGAAWSGTSRWKCHGHVLRIRHSAGGSLACWKTCNRYRRLPFGTIGCNASHWCSSCWSLWFVGSFFRTCCVHESGNKGWHYLKSEISKLKEKPLRDVLHFILLVALSRVQDVTYLHSSSKGLNEVLKMDFLPACS